jgi:hypothetical protein
MATTPTIPYASAPTPTDVSVERDAHHLRVVIPPLMKWHELGGAYFALMLLLLGMVIGMGVAVVDSGGLHKEMLPSLAMWVFGLCGGVAYGFIRLQRWTIFTVTADRFEVATRIGTWRARTLSWPFGQVARVKRSIVTNHLIVRVRGRDFLEFIVSRDPTVTAFVADTLDLALHSGLQSIPKPALPAEAPAKEKALQVSLGTQEKEYHL